MGRGDWLVGCHDEDQREMRALQADPDGLVEGLALDRDQPSLNGPPLGFEGLDRGFEDCRGAVVGQVGEQENPDAGPGHRLAPEMAEKGIVEFLAGGHERSRSRRSGLSGEGGAAG